MIFKLKADFNPQKTVTLLHAIRQGVEAQKEVKPLTIQACFQKSTVLEKPLLVTLNLESDLQGTWNKVEVQLQRILSVENEEILLVDNFISPVEEEIVDDESNILEVISDRYTEVEEEIDEEEVEEEETVKVSLSEALRSLEALSLYKL